MRWPLEWKNILLNNKQYAVFPLLAECVHLQEPVLASQRDHPQLMTQASGLAYPLLQSLVKFRSLSLLYNPVSFFFSRHYE